ncbi:caspase, EACC1-associated type [Sphaerisporangium dianthi]|uniref:Caspase family protein n=1 Tax=Sphaerisporangium dianthi TaxID=1436120 RepID=A0ABV9CLQ1_9ACTN
MTAGAPTDLSGPGVQVLLVGVSRYPAADQRYLPDVPAVETTVEDLRETLVTRCGVAESSITELLNPDGPERLYSAISEVSRRATTVFLLYFAGHGNLTSDRFYLGTAKSDQRTYHLRERWLDFGGVADALAENAVASTVVILDCCFSGHASLHGGAHYLLASAGPTEFALAPPGARHTAFTGRLIELLRDGAPTAPYALKLDDVYRHLDRTLKVRPHHRSGDLGQNLLIAHNPAYRPPDMPGGPSGDRDESADTACPYPGMAPYGTDMARYFHGQGKAVDELADRLHGDARPFMLIGPSGFGKSSLLRAGLIPAVRQRGIDGRAVLDILVEPGTAPLSALARAVARATRADDAGIRAALDTDPAGALRRALEPVLGADGRALLVVDQFEAVFSAPEAEREAFVTAVLPIEPGPLHVVLAVRPDFTGHCLAYPALADLLDDRPYYLRPMTEPELREAIQGPARAAGLDLADGLVTLLLRELRGGRVPALPQLSYALTVTWAHRADRVLTVQAYEESGGIDGALRKAAEEADAALTGPLRPVARRMLLALVIGPHDDLVICRPVPLARLLGEEADAAAARQVLQVLTDARLLSVDGERNVSIVHDSLTGSWPLLAEVIALNRDWIRRRGQLEADAAAWRAARPETRERAVYQDAILDGAVALARSRDDVPALVTAFLNAGLEHRERLVLAERRVNRRLWRLAAALAVVSVLVAATSVIAFRQRGEAVTAARVAVEQRDVADSGRLGRTAVALVERRPNLARQLALTAYRISPTPEAYAALFALQSAPAVVELGQHVHHAAVRPDGRLMALGGGNVLLWDLERRTARGKLNPGSGALTFTEFVLGGRGLLTATTDGIVLLWDVSDPDRPSITVDLTDVMGRADEEFDDIDTMALSPDRRILAIFYTRDGDRRGSALWDVADPAHPRRLSLSLGRIRGLAERLVFSGDGSMLAAAEGGAATLFDVSRPRAPRRLAKIDYGAWGMGALAFSPDGRVLATGDGNIDGFAGGVDTVQLWDISTPARPRRLRTLNGHTNRVNGLVFSPDGATLLSASQDSTLGVWDVRDPGTARQVRVLSGHFDPVADVGLLPGGAGYFSASLDGAVRLWDAADLTSPGALASFTLPGKHPRDTDAQDDLLDVAFSPDGRTLVSAAMDGTARVWSVADPRHPVLRQTLDEHGSWVNSAAFTPDGRLLITAGRDADVVVSAVSPQGEIRRLTEFTPDPGSVVWWTAVSPDGRVLATSGQTPALWDLTSPAEDGEPALLARLPGDPIASTRAVAISDDGALLAVGDQRAEIRVYKITDPHHPEPLARFIAPGDELSTMAFRPGGHILAASGGSPLKNRADERRLQLWDLSPPRYSRKLADVQDHQDWMNEVAFSRDGRLLAAAGAYETRVWDVSVPTAPHLVATLDAHDGEAAAVAFGPGGLLATASDGKIALYPTTPEQLVARLCSSFGASISRSEWEQYMPGRTYSPPCGPPADDEPAARPTSPIPGPVTPAYATPDPRATTPTPVEVDLLRIGDCFESGPDRRRVLRLDCSAPHTFEVVADGENEQGGCYTKVHRLFPGVRTPAEDAPGPPSLYWGYFERRNRGGQAFCYVWRPDGAKTTGSLLLRATATP